MPLFGLITPNIFLLVFFLRPLLITAYYSFYDGSFNALTLKNYIEALTNPAYLSVIYTVPNSNVNNGCYKQVLVPNGWWGCPDLNRGPESPSLLA